MPDSVRVLGIDPGLIHTGWALVESSTRESRVLEHGLVQPRKDAELPIRLADGAAQLREVLTRTSPILVCLEEVFTTPKHPRSALLMAHMRGVICLVVQEAGVPILSLTATTVKQRVTGSGHASKEQVQRMVARLTGMDPTVRLRSDITDAVALAIAGGQQARPGVFQVHGDREAALARLAELGVLDLPSRRSRGSVVLNRLIAEATEADRAQRALRRV